MLGLSFNTKSNVPVFAVFKCQNIIYLLFIYPYNIHIKQNVLHNGDNAKQHRFYNIFKLSSVFFPYVWPVVFIMIKNRLYLVECLNELKLDLFPFQQWKQLLLVMKIIGIVKGLLLFVYINNKKNYLCFFVK